MDKDKVCKILQLKRPNTLRQLRGFLGMANYYRKYIPNFSRIVASLVSLTKNEVVYEWTSK